MSLESCNEIIDRIYIIQSTIEDHVIQHAISKSNEAVRANIQKALDSLEDSIREITLISNNYEQER